MLVSWGLNPTAHAQGVEQVGLAEVDQLGQVRCEVLLRMVLHHHALRRERCALSTCRLHLDTAVCRVANDRARSPHVGSCRVQRHPGITLVHMGRTIWSFSRETVTHGGA